MLAVLVATAALAAWPALPPEPPGWPPLPPEQPAQIATESSPAPPSDAAPPLPVSRQQVPAAASGEMFPPAGCPGGVCPTVPAYPAGTRRILRRFR